MPDIELEDIKRRSVAGVFALTSRTAVLQIVAFVGTFLLTIFLSPSVFGVFFVVSAVVSFLNYFSDIGLAAALVQREQVSKIDLNTTFMIQQALVLTIVLLSLLFSQNMASFYKLSAEGLWLLRALIIAFFFVSLKTIPSVILERQLNFDKLVIPQIVEVLLFYAIAVILAWKGMGIQSFTWAVIARSIIGVIVIYLIQPWWPGFTFNRASARRLLSFGVPFQLNSFLGLVKDDLFTLYLGKVLPFTLVGYIGWAKKWAEVPLRLIMDSIIRVTFPAYSRLQSYPEKLTKAIDKSLFFLALFIMPMAVGLLLVVKPLVTLIPKYAKWEPALLSFYFFIIGSVLASISTPLTNALNAVGKIKTSLKLMLMWVFLTWTISPLFIQIIGFNGVAVAHSLIGISLGIVVWISKKHFQFSIIDNVKPALVAASGAGLLGLLLRAKFTNTFVGLLVYGLILLVAYVLVLFCLYKHKIVREVQSILLTVQK